MRFTSLLLALALSNASLLAQASYTLETVAEDLNFPWSIAFTPDGDYLVAMRSGRCVAFRQTAMYHLLLKVYLLAMY